MDLILDELQRSEDILPSVVSFNYCYIRWHMIILSDRVQIATGRTKENSSRLG